MSTASGSVRYKDIIKQVIEIGLFDEAVRQNATSKIARRQNRTVSYNCGLAV